MRRRSAFLVGVAAAVLVGGALRLSTYRELQDGDRVRAVSDDDYYHLRRARFAVANFPRTILLDPLMNFPQGGVSIWPPLFDLTLALPALLAEGSDAPAEAVERGAAVVPLLYAAGTILLAGLLGKQLYGTAGGVVTAFFVAVSPAHVLWSQYGHSEQHVAESFFGLTALSAYVASRRRPGDATREALAGGALALAVLAWQGAIFWGAIFALSLFLEALVARRSVFRPAVLMLGVPALLVAAATSFWTRGLDLPFTYVSFGFFQPAFLAALAGGTIALEGIVRAVRRQASARELVARAVFSAVALALLVPRASDLAASFAGGVGYVAGKTHEVSGAGGYVSYPSAWLEGIFEARPLFADGPGLPVRQLSLALFLAPIVIVLWALRALRLRRAPDPRSRAAVWIALAVWGTVTIFLALSQRVNVYYAVPLVALALVESVRWIAVRTRRAAAPRAAGSRARPRPRTSRIAALAGAALALPMAAGIVEEVRATRVAGSDLFDTLSWMRRELPRPVDVYDPRLLAPPYPPQLSLAASVLGPWSLGHLVLYEAELPVVANNFGYGFLDSIRFFLAASEEEALAIARSHRARWVVAADLVPRMNDYARYVGRPPLLRPAAGGLAPTAGYFRTLQSRLYDFDAGEVRVPGLTLPPLRSFRRVFASRTGTMRGGRFVARWKVFEIVDAAAPPAP